MTPGAGPLPRFGRAARALLSGVVLVVPLTFVVPQGGLTKAAEHSRGQPGSLVAQTPTGGGNQALVQQKLALFERYINAQSVSRILQSEEPEPKHLLTEAKALLAEARAAAEEGRYDRAGELIDLGLRKISKASGMVGSTTATRAVAEDQSGCEAARRRAGAYLDGLSQEERTGLESAQQRLLAQVQDLLTQAEGFLAAGRYHDCSTVSGKAHQLAVALVSELRKGRTVISSLRFETAADEYNYERDRNSSYESLVVVLLGKDEAPSSLRALATRSLEENRVQRSAAESQAAQGELAAAIRTMELATKSLIRALNAGGLMIGE